MKSDSDQSDASEDEPMETDNNNDQVGMSDDEDA